MPVHSSRLRVACHFDHRRDVPREFLDAGLMVIDPVRPHGTPNELVYLLDVN